ncbi:MAG: DUF1641 domain-containing protein [Archaeoglobaceae archaeon]|nr:DUF1641 domain-containing protein [Archaeoglobaceae archaeon]MDW8128143.1 DUF1641 domain-containing protein [Archaeoglobaceae archaeon]
MNEEVARKIEENKDAILSAIDKLVWLEKSGNLDAIIGFASLIKIFQDSLSDAVIDKISEILTNLGLLSAKFTNDRSLMLLNAIGDAICRCEKEPEPIGLLGIIKALRDPEVKKSIGTLLNIAKGLGKEI